MTATVDPEDAPLCGDCSICRRFVDRGSFCCGCGHFVCWTHGEPDALRGADGSSHGFAKTPHALEEHRPHARSSAA